MSPALAWDQTVNDGPKAVVAAQIIACLASLGVDCGVVALLSQLVILSGGEITAQSLATGIGPVSLSSTEQFNNSFAVVSNGILNIDNTAIFQSSTTPIPEPSSIALLTVGGLSVALGCCRRSKFPLKFRMRDAGGVSAS